MFDRTQLLRIISGETRGLLAGVVRGLLSCCTPLYRLGIAYQNRKYNRAEVTEEPQGVIQKVAAPVISIGNLTTGGTGKTPLVIWLTQQLLNFDVQLCILSRGYGSDEGPNDEAMEIAARMPTILHLQSRKRIEIAEQAIQNHGAEVLLLDDGFQHRKLHRDLDIVLIDASCPFGFERLLPRGLLREPLASLSRADLLVITRVDRVDDARLEDILARLRRHLGTAKAAPIAICRTVPQYLIQTSGTRKPFASLAGNVFVSCAIGNPNNFLNMLKGYGHNVVGHTFFPDHHHFQPADHLEISRLAKTAQADCILCTHKDLVKLNVDQIEGLPLYAVEIALEFVAGETIIMDAVHRTINQHTRLTPIRNL